MNMTSSTESKLVGNSEYVTFNFWMIILMEAQGYAVMGNVLIQDNQISIKM